MKSLECLTKKYYSRILPPISLTEYVDRMEYDDGQIFIGMVVVMLSDEGRVGVGSISV